jgi:hypothetical protein
MIATRERFLRRVDRGFLVLAVALALAAVALVLAQDPPSQERRRLPPPVPPTPTPISVPPIERLADGRVRIESIEVDTRRAELRAPGVVNDAMVLEYLATDKTGLKSYESVLQIEASATAFNVALLLLGLDEGLGVPATTKFQPEPPVGDRVAVWLEWQEGGRAKRIAAEDVIWNQATQKTLEPGPWVYAAPKVDQRFGYLPQAVGVMVGFMHTPESILDSPRPLGAAYGAFVRNPEYALEPGTPVTLVVRPWSERKAGKGAD